MAKGDHALTLYNLQNYKEAAEIQKLVIEGREQLQGLNHAETLKSKANYAAILKNLWRYDETLEIERDIIKRSEEVLGDKHPDTLSFKCNYAITLKSLKRKKEAEKILMEVIEDLSQAAPQTSSILKLEKRALSLLQSFG